jgi:hypothetical protein
MRPNQNHNQEQKYRGKESLCRRHNCCRPLTWASYSDTSAYNVRLLRLVQLRRPLRALARRLEHRCQKILIEFGQITCFIVHGANPQRVRRHPKSC